MISLYLIFKQKSGTYPRKIVYFTLITTVLFAGFLSGFASELPIGEWEDTPTTHLFTFSYKSNLERIQQVSDQIVQREVTELKENFVGKIDDYSFLHFEINIHTFMGNSTFELSHIFFLNFDDWNFSEYPRTDFLIYSNQNDLTDLGNLTYSPEGKDSTLFNLSFHLLSSQSYILETLLKESGVSKILFTDISNLSSMYSSNEDLWIDRLFSIHILYFSDLSQNELLSSYHGRTAWNKFIKFVKNIESLEGIRRSFTNNHAAEMIENANEYVPVSLAIPILIFVVSTVVTFSLLQNFQSEIRKQDRMQEKTLLNLGLKSAYLVGYWIIEGFLLFFISILLSTTLLLIFVKLIFSLSTPIILDLIYNSIFSWILYLLLTMLLLLPISLSIRDLDYLAPNNRNSMLIKLIKQIPKVEKTKTFLYFIYIVWFLMVLYFIQNGSNTAYGWFALIFSLIPIFTWYFIGKINSFTLRLNISSRIVGALSKSKKSESKVHFKVYNHVIWFSVKLILIIFVTCGIFFSFFILVDEHVNNTELFENGGEISFSVLRGLDSSYLEELLEIGGVSNAIIYHDIEVDDLLQESSIISQNYRILAIPATEISKLYFKSFEDQSKIITSDSSMINSLNNSGVFISPGAEILAGSSEFFKIWYSNDNKERSLNLTIRGELIRLPGFNSDLPLFKSDVVDNIGNTILISETSMFKLPNVSYSSDIFLRVEQEKIQSVSKELKDNGFEPNLVDNSGVTTLIFPNVMFVIGSIAIVGLVVIHSSRSSEADLTRFTLLMYTHNKNPWPKIFQTQLVQIVLVTTPSLGIVTLFIISLRLSILVAWTSWLEVLILLIIGLIILIFLVIYNQKRSINRLEKKVKERTLSVLLEGAAL